MKKTLACLLLTLLTLAVCSAAALATVPATPTVPADPPQLVDRDWDIDIVGNDGLNNTHVYDVILEPNPSGGIVVIHGNYDEMISYARGGELGRWVGLVFSTDLGDVAGTADQAAVKLDGVTLDADDVGEANQFSGRIGDTDSFIYWVDINDLLGGSGLFKLSYAGETDATKYSQYILRFDDCMQVGYNLPGSISASATPKYYSKSLPSFSINFAAAAGYSLPAAINISIDGRAMSGDGYNYDSGDGWLVIDSSYYQGRGPLLIGFPGGAEGYDPDTGEILFTLTGYYADGSKTPVTYFNQARLPVENYSYAVSTSRIDTLRLTLYAEDMSEHRPELKYGSVQLSPTASGSIVLDSDSYQYYTYQMTGVAGNKDLYLRFGDGDYESAQLVFDLSGSSLSSIQFSAGSDSSYSASGAVRLFPAFDPAITEYTALIPYDRGEGGTMSCGLQLAFSDRSPDFDFITAGFDNTVSGAANFNGFHLSVGEEKTVRFVVDGVEYKLHFLYGDDDLSRNCAPLNIGLYSDGDCVYGSELPIYPAFDADVMSYNVRTSYDPDSDYYLLVDTEKDDKCLVFINNIRQNTDDGDCIFSFRPADYSSLEVIIYSQNLKNSLTYTISLSPSGALSDLSLYNSTHTTKYVLSPTFDSNTIGYVANFSHSMSAISLNATSEQPLSITHSVGSQVYTRDLSVPSGLFSAWPLYVGLNEFDICAGSRHYYLNVYRQPLTRSVAVSPQLLSVNGGVQTAIPAYNINGNNFVQLRSVAYLLRDTAKRFAVTFNYDYERSRTAIYLQKGSAYSDFTGHELALPSIYRSCSVSSQLVMLGDGQLNFDGVYPMAYNIDGYNYYLLRDLAALFNFGVDYSGNTVYIDTNTSYGGGGAAGETLYYGYPYGSYGSNTPGDYGYYYSYPIGADPYQYVYGNGYQDIGWGYGGI